MTVRDTDWKHFQVVGDIAAAQDYLPEANKLLGFVKQEAARNGLQTYQVTQKQDDGTVIIAEIRGGIPRVTVIPATPASSLQQQDQDAFVVWARDADHVPGIDATYPQQLLRLGSSGWTTYFKDDSIAGYDDFAGTKGTYGGRFPKGVCYGGNIDWVGRNGERVSWYGPPGRYWCTPYRQLTATYGKYAFYLGQILLDVDAFCTAQDVNFTARHVLGAGIIGDVLYVMHAQFADIVTPSLPDATTGDPFHITYPFAQGDVYLELRAYSLDPTHTVVGGTNPNPLWSGSYAGACNPWFFCATKGIFSTVTMAADVRVRLDANGSFNGLIYDRTIEQWPSSSCNRMDVTLSTSGGSSAELSTTPLSLPTGTDVTALVAIDYDKNGNECQGFIGRQSIGDDDCAAVFQFGTTGPVVQLMYGLGHEINVGGMQFSDAYFWARLLWCDLRYQSAVITAQPGYFSPFYTDTDTTYHGYTNWYQFQSTQMLFGGKYYNLDGLVSYEIVTGHSIYSSPFYWGALPSHDLTKTLPYSLSQNAIAPTAMMAMVLYDRSNGTEAPGVIDNTGNQPYIVDYPAAESFGSFSFVSQYGGTATDGVWSYVCPTDDYFSQDQLDTLGRRSNQVAAAANETAAMASIAGSYVDIGVDPTSQTLYRNASLSLALPSSDLPDLTGVNGTNQRFHPLWLLGQPVPRTIS